jgi:hypothetical protein
VFAEGVEPPLAAAITSASVVELERRLGKDSCTSSHPGRAFAGRAQMRANWEAMFAGIPGFHAEICRSVQDGETTWAEWR